MTMPTGYVLGDMATKAAYFLRSSGGIHLCRDDVVARSSPLSFQPSRLLQFAEPTASFPPRFQEFIGWLLSYIYWVAG
jgi:hypothetical protein